MSYLDFAQLQKMPSSFLNKHNMAQIDYMRRDYLPHDTLQ